MYGQFEHGAHKMKGYAKSLSTPDGPFAFIVNERGSVIASGWVPQWGLLVQRIHPEHTPEQIIECGTGDTDDTDDTLCGGIEDGGVENNGVENAAAAVVAYYDGDFAAPMLVPVEQHGTPLQKLGHRVLRQITAGDALTYAEFAARLDRPDAARAAASICARNAVGLFVPCHRVLRGDGGLGGFAWGTEIKETLLAREGFRPANETLF